MFMHVGIFYDNSTAVTWANKYSMSKSIIAGKLLVIWVELHE